MLFLRRSIALFLVALMVISICPISAFAGYNSANKPNIDIEEEKQIYGNYEYKLLEDGTAAICGYNAESFNSSERLHLEIPVKVNGIKVTQISQEAFAYNDLIETVAIPNGIVAIENAAFYHCENLKAIAFYGDMPNFGFTILEGSKKMERVFVLKEYDASVFCAILVSDLGEKKASQVQISEYDDLSLLKEAYAEYINSLDSLTQHDKGTYTFKKEDLENLFNVDLEELINKSKNQKLSLAPVQSFATSIPAKDLVLKEESTAVISSDMTDDQVKKALFDALVENPEGANYQDYEWEYECEGWSSSLNVWDNKIWGSINGFVSRKNIVGIMMTFEHPALKENQDDTWSVRLVGGTQEAVIVKLSKYYANYSELNALISEVETILLAENIHETYTVTSLDFLREKYEAALQVPTDLDINHQNQIDSAASELTAAVAGLVRLANYTALQSAVNTFRTTINAEWFDPADYNPVKALADAAEEALKPENRLPGTTENQRAINAQTMELTKAMTALKAKMLPADYAALEDALADGIEKLNKEQGYTAETIKVLEDAYLAGLKISQDKPYKKDEQSKVDAAEQAIRDAIAGLKFADAKYEQLNAAIAAAEAELKRTDIGDFTASSIEALYEALEAARNVAPDLTVDQQEVIDNAASALRAAIRGLELKPANYAVLDATIEAREAELADARLSSKFTDASMARLEAAIGVAKTVDRTYSIKEQSMIDDAVKVLNSVQLEKKEDGTFYNVAVSAGEGVTVKMDGNVVSGNVKVAEGVEYTFEYIPDDNTSVKAVKLGEDDVTTDVSFANYVGTQKLTFTGDTTLAVESIAKNAELVLTETREAGIVINADGSWNYDGIRANLIDALIDKAQSVGVEFTQDNVEIFYRSGYDTVWGGGDGFYEALDDTDHSLAWHEDFSALAKSEAVNLRIFFKGNDQFRATDYVYVDVTFNDVQNSVIALRENPVVTINETSNGVFDYTALEQKVFNVAIDAENSVPSGLTLEDIELTVPEVTATGDYDVTAKYPGSTSYYASEVTFKVHFDVVKLPAANIVLKNDTVSAVLKETSVGVYDNAALKEEVYAAAVDLAACESEGLDTSKLVFELQDVTAEGTYTATVSYPDTETHHANSVTVTVNVTVDKCPTVQFEQVADSAVLYRGYDRDSYNYDGLKEDIFNNVLKVTGVEGLQWSDATYEYKVYDLGGTIGTYQPFDLDHIWGDDSGDLYKYLRNGGTFDIKVSLPDGDDYYGGYFEFKLNVFVVNPYVSEIVTNEGIHEVTLNKTKDGGYDYEALKQEIFAAAVKEVKNVPESFELKWDAFDYEYKIYGTISEDFYAFDEQNGPVDAKKFLRDGGEFTVRIFLDDGDGFYGSFADVTINVTVEDLYYAEIALRENYQKDYVLNYGADGQFDYDRLEKEIFDAVIDIENSSDNVNFDTATITYQILDSMGTSAGVGAGEFYPFNQGVLGTDLAGTYKYMYKGGTFNIKVAVPGDENHRAVEIVFSINVEPSAMLHSNVVLNNGSMNPTNDIDAIKAYVFSLIDMDASSLPADVSIDDFTFEYYARNYLPGGVPGVEYRWVPFEGEEGEFGIYYKRIDDGTHKIRVRFNGTDDYLACTSNEVELTISKASFSIELKQNYKYFDEDLPSDFIKPSVSDNFEHFYFILDTSSDQAIIYLDSLSGIEETDISVLPTTLFQTVLGRSAIDVYDKGLSRDELIKLVYSDELADYARANYNIDKVAIDAMKDIVNSIPRTVTNIKLQEGQPSKRGIYTIFAMATSEDYYTAYVIDTFYVRDYEVPDQIIEVRAIGDVAAIYLTWAISSEADTNIYRIYRRAEFEETFQMIAQINDRNVLSYTDKDVEQDTVYYYYVIAVNELEQTSEPSVIVEATLSKDDEKPVVTKLNPYNGSFLTGKVNITFTAQDNVSVVKGEIYYSIDDGKTWILISQKNLGNFSIEFDTTNLPDGVVHIKGVAYDAAGNVSDGLIYVYSVDNTGPSQVQGVTYESTSVTTTLRWNNVPDDDIYYYVVERKNSDGSYSNVMTVYNTVGANIYNLVPDSEYTYRIVGYDRQGNRGIPSEDISVRTKGDTTVPVVTKIRPTSGYYSDDIDLSITASDEYNVKTIIIQVSTDAVTWNDVYTKSYTDISKSRTLNCTLSLDNYNEGLIFVRAVVIDGAGNKSDTSESAPYVQHIVDKTAPAVPQGVKAEGQNGYIEISWEMGKETDLRNYSVYRAESKDGEYKLIKDGLKSLNYFDRNVKEGIIYYYKVKVDDIAQNQSGFSVPVSASVIEDTEPPVIVSVYPESGKKLGYGYKTIGVLAADNKALYSILIEYSGNATDFKQLYKLEKIGVNSKTVNATVPVEEFSNGDTVYIRITVVDESGNVSEAVTIAYLVDTVAPNVASASAKYDDESVLIQWTGNLESDLIGYRVYRKAGLNGTYSLIAQRQVVPGQQNYSCYDYNLSIEKTSYIYKIEAVDACGNTSSYVTGKVEVPDRSAPKPMISCESTFEVGVEYIIDASLSTDNSAIVSYHFDFGDGTTSDKVKAVHVYDEVGEYVITLTVTDDDGNKSVYKKEVTVKERALTGTARILIVDENNVPVPGAPVYFDLGDKDQVIKVTDSRGYVTFTAGVGRHTIGCVISNNEWLPVKKDIIVTAGNITTVTMTLIRHVMIEGNFEITRMTFEEIVAAGIDVSKPENQYIVNVNVTLTYGSEEIETSFKYNETTKETIVDPTIVTTPDGEKRQIVPVVISPGRGNADGDYNFSKEASIAYLDIPVGVSSLKEFFNVNLHIINNSSSEFSMIDNIIKLNVPKGLTIVETYATQGSADVSIAEIKGQTSTTITWILRGDEVGKYMLTADYSGVLSEFDEPIYTQFVASDPIEVYGLTNLKFKMEIPDALDHGTFYYNVMLLNEGRIDVYCPRIDTGDVLIETQLFAPTGLDITEGNSDVISITGELDVLFPGYSFMKHYMSIDQTLYTEKKQELMEYLYTVQNTYGLEIEIVEMPLSYFKESLNAKINAIEKAELTFTTNKNAYDYLMTNENFIYWSMYASTGRVKSALTSNGQEFLWNLLKVASGSGGLDQLFGAGDDEQVRTIILDALEISTEESDYSKYYAVLDWSKGIEKWLKDAGSEEWKVAVASWAAKYAQKFTAEQLKNFIQKVIDSLPRTYELIGYEYRWELYISVTQGEYMDYDNFIITKWQEIFVEENESLTAYFEETDCSQLLHKVFSADNFKTVWEGIGFAADIAEKLVKAAEKTSTDISLFFAAQQNIDGCNVFLDTLIDNIPQNSADAKKVVKEAKVLKKTLNELDPMGSFITNFIEDVTSELFWKSMDNAKDKVLDYTGISKSKIVIAIKVVLKITVAIGDNIFNVSERHDIADNIRFVSHISEGMRIGIEKAQGEFLKDKSNTNAVNYMQLINYMINVRAIGESQVASFGITYEVLPGVFDSKELFLAVKEMSGADEANSWITWRDYVEDKLSLIRVKLLKNPLTEDVSGLTAPTITFDYANGRTAQKFTDEYEYSLDRGRTWNVCSGDYIYLSPEYYSVEIQVRRVDIENSDEKLVGSVIVYPPASLSNSGIIVLKTENGYRVENLDENRKYEITFSDEPKSYKYEDSLQTVIPDGSYSYEYKTDKEYEYIYIRSLGDSEQYASYIYQPPIFEMLEVKTETDGSGTVTGSGKYEYGEKVTLIATAAENFEFEGWYENGEKISSDAVIEFEVFSARTLTAKFIKSSYEWNINEEKGTVTGISEGTSSEEIIAHYNSEGIKVTVTTNDGQETDMPGTGCLLNIGEKSYEIVISGDVTGDSYVDVFDLFTMLDHVNSVSILEGAYFDAGCVNGNESIDVFDVFTSLDYVNKEKYA